MPDGGVNVHGHDDDSIAAADYLLRRDHLRRDPGHRALYERTKRRLLEREWPDGAGYAEAKTDVIEQIKGRARRLRQ